MQTPHAVLTARKLFNWAVAANDAGNPFPVSVHWRSVADRLMLACSHAHTAGGAVVGAHHSQPLTLCATDRACT